MKLFKCISKNASFVQEQERIKKPKYRLSFKHKKRRANADDMTSLTPNRPLTPKSGGRSVRFTLPDKENTPVNTYSSVNNGTVSTGRRQPGSSIRKSNSAKVSRRICFENSLCQPILKSLTPCLKSAIKSIYDDDINTTMDVNSTDYLPAYEVHSPASTLASTDYTMDADYLTSYEANTTLLDSITTEQYDNSTFGLDQSCQLHYDTAEIAVTSCDDDSQTGSITATMDEGFSFNPNSETVSSQNSSVIANEIFIQRHRFTHKSVSESTINSLPTAVCVKRQAINDYFQHVIGGKQKTAASCDSRVEEMDVDGETASVTSDVTESVFSGSVSVYKKNLGDAVPNGTDVKKHPQEHSKSVLTSVDQNVWRNKSSNRKRILVTVPQDKCGFGLSFVGDFPPKIGRVEKDSPADKAGVQKDDKVLRLNGRNVSRSSSRSLVHMIRKLDLQYLTLELQRDHTVNETIEASTCDYQRNHIPSYKHKGGSTSMDSFYDNTLESEAAASQSCDGNSVDHSLVSNILTKYECIHRLMSLELEYIDFMHYGMERYSRPLRHCILSGHQKVTIFQNVEKLVKISEYHLRQMQDNSSISTDTELQSNEDVFLYMPAVIYESQIHTLCNAYETYARGVDRSNALLLEMKKNKAFMNFIKDTESGSDQCIGRPSISDFINRPSLHIKELYNAMNEIFTSTPLDSPDLATLKIVVDKLEQCINKTVAEVTSAGRVKNLEAHISSLSTRDDEPTRHDNKAGSHRSTASVKSQDMLHEHENLVFSPCLQHFQQCVKEKHLIYKGQIYKCNKKGSWFKYHLLLFSDLILTATEKLDGSLYVSENPVSLHNLSSLEMNRQHASEFVLHLDETHMNTQLNRGQSSDFTSGKLILRAPSPQEKFMWTNLIEQRIALVTGNTLEQWV